MAYRVGFQCVNSQEMAHDLVLSGLPPVLLPDGSFQHVHKVGNAWFYNGQSVKLDFPECSPAEQFGSGFVLGASFLTFFVVLVGFRAFYNMIHMIGSKDAG